MHLTKVGVAGLHGCIFTRWGSFIDAIEFNVPYNQGMLWSKLGGSAKAIAKAQQKNLVCLEMELEKTAFFGLYQKDFGASFQKWIWDRVSKRYVRSLRGKVTGYVHRASHFKHINASAEKTAKTAGVDLKDLDKVHAIKKMVNTGDPVLVAEENEISELLLANPNITELGLIDIETGETFGYRTREIQEWFRRAEQK